MRAFILLSAVFVIASSEWSACQADIVASDPADLTVVLQAGSSQFQIGQVIPVQITFSSSTPNRYLEPCELFVQRNFGFPQCRFHSRWSFEITPNIGWVDYTKLFEGRGVGGGPTFEVPNRDLTTQPTTFDYHLTQRFRFDEPGEYRVRISIEVGLDDESTARPGSGLAVQAQTMPPPHAVLVTREITFSILPASPRAIEWEKEIIRKGVAAHSASEPQRIDPPSLERTRYEEDTEALCYLGTSEAARSLARIALQEHAEVRECLVRSPSLASAIDEMHHLILAPDVAVREQFFQTFLVLLGMQESRRSQRGLFPMIYQASVDRERDNLFNALPSKRGEAKIASLLTILQNPPRNSTEFPGYELPFSPEVLEAVAADFDHLPYEWQTRLLSSEWDSIRSPLIIPTLRARAKVGDGLALLRWLELEPTAASEFGHAELVRPVPRFSWFYLRLRGDVSKNEQEQVARNFTALTQEYNLARSASLLHYYGSRDVLPIVLPFIDAHLYSWPCSVQYPVLAYLLKVSPSDAAPRVRKAWEIDHAHSNYPSCRYTFLADLGILQANRELEKLALEQFVDPAALPEAVRDAADYLERYGSKSAKPLIWKALTRLKKGESSGAEKRVADSTATRAEQSIAARLIDLGNAYAKAQGWVLSPKEADAAVALLGKRWGDSTACIAHCGQSFAHGPVPSHFAIYGRMNPWTRTIPFEYLNPVERLHYSIDQYQCPGLRTLKEKLLQFPVGSTFDFAYDFTARDRDEIVAIGDFLWDHGYKVRNGQQWPFLKPDPSQ